MYLINQKQEFKFAFKFLQLTDFFIFLLSAAAGVVPVLQSPPPLLQSHRQLLGDPSLLQHLVQLLDINMNEVSIRDDSVSLSIRLQLFLMITCHLMSATD